MNGQSNGFSQEDAVKMTMRGMRRVFRALGSPPKPLTPTSEAQEAEAALGPVQQLLRSCQDSFTALVEFFGEHPASMNELEFWGTVRSFLRAFADTQRRLQRDSQVGARPPNGG